MTAPKYRWAQPRFESLVPARQFGPWLNGLPDRNPATIVAQAASPRSPAHKLFQWDDTLAAREHRLNQARVLLGSFVIETEVTMSGRKSRVIAVPYVSRSARGQYEITTEAMREPDKRDFMLGEALKEGKRWRRRYADLSELAVVFASMDEVDARVTRRRKR